MQGHIPEWALIPSVCALNVSNGFLDHQNLLVDTEMSLYVQ